MQTVFKRNSENKDRRSSEQNPDIAQQFDVHYPRIYNYLRYRVSSQEDVEDLISTIFERAYTRRTQYDQSKGSFSTWLFRIAHNTLANHYRTHERRSIWETEAEPPADLITSEPSLENQLVQQETIARLMRGLENLSERDQELISLKFAGQLRNREIGEIMDMKEKTVSVSLLRAMRRLRKQVEKEVA